MMPDPGDTQFMARALRLAERGIYTVHPNPAVGCVLVRQGKIVGEGYHRQAGQGHAEANALTAAGEDARAATAYVTLEPCSFHGRTPSCAKALIDAGVSRVVVATMDPDPRNAGAGIRMLKDAGLEVDVPLLEPSARMLIRGHAHRHECGRPFVRLKLAMSLDGKTALSNGESKWITSAEARGDVQRLRASSAAIVTGVQTVIQDDPMLNVREDTINITEAALAASIRRPVYILDSNARTPAASRLLSRDDTVLVTGPDTRVDMSVETLVTPLQDGRIHLEPFLRLLASREHSDVLFECGATLAGSLIAAGLVDELVIYVAPRLLGADARSLLNLPELVRMSDLVELTITDFRPVGADFRITASVAQ